MRGCAFGVASSEPLTDVDGGRSFYAALRQLGMRECRLPFYREWEDVWHRRLEDALDHAVAHGIGVSVAYLGLPPSIGRTADAKAFARDLAGFARVHPLVRRIVVWSEPNSVAFWAPPGLTTPQGRANLYTELLAFSYDALKRVDPKVKVCGFGLAKSHDPVAFVKSVAASYRASRRPRPLFDEVNYHPYPAGNAQSAVACVRTTDKIVRELRLGFAGTAQPLFSEGLLVNLAECGWQAGVEGHEAAYDPAPVRPGGRPGENVQPVSDNVQAENLVGYVHAARGHPYVRAAYNYRLVDDRELYRWQSGLIRADGTRRPAFVAMRQAIRQG